LHPAEEAAREIAEGDEPFVFVEKFGVSDPEGVWVSAQTLMASALCNIVIKDVDHPDLIIHHSSTSISEYDNPALFLDMFPTLFPYGIGGFETEYLLDISDHSFRKHTLFMFVALNMLYRCHTHLQTYSTMKQ
jgi:hypothetical protein